MVNISSMNREVSLNVSIRPYYLDLRRWFIKWEEHSLCPCKSPLVVVTSMPCLNVYNSRLRHDKNVSVCNHTAIFSKAIFSSIDLLLWMNVMHDLIGMVLLRLCKTAITWLRSLSAILLLFWRHDIAELNRLCREDFRNVLWRHEICDVFPRIMTSTLQNMQFSQYFTTKFNIFSLNLTGESDVFILIISTHNKLSMSGFW